MNFLTLNLSVEFSSTAVFSVIKEECLKTVLKKKTDHSLRLRFLVDLFGGAGTVNVFNFLVSSRDCKSRRKKQIISVIIFF